MVDPHEQPLQSATAFLAEAGRRPRALVVTGPPGIGKSRFLDRLHIETLAAGRFSVLVLDSADASTSLDLDELRARLDGDASLRLLVAATEIHDGLLSLLDERCERRVMALLPFSDAEGRALLAELGVHPWSVRARQVLDESSGVPRRLIDLALRRFTPASLPVADASYQPGAWTWRAAQRLELVHRDQHEAHQTFIANARAVADEVTASGEERADATMVLAHTALLEGEFEDAIQLGERAAVARVASEAVNILGAAFAATARAVLGEVTGMLSLHALAGRASRARLPVVEAMTWHMVCWASGNMGDVTTCRRAAVRCIEICDATGAVALGLQARLALADLEVSGNNASAARALLDEVAVISEARGLSKLRIDATLGAARTSLALGDVDDACRLADGALEAVLRATSCRIRMVDAAVVTARAYAMAGSTDLALAPLDTLWVGRVDTGSADFWLAIEAVRVLGRCNAKLDSMLPWLERLARFDRDGFGGALRAAHAEAEAWRSWAEGRRSEARRLAQRARTLWVEAECHEEVELTDPLLTAAPDEPERRFTLLGSTTTESQPAQVRADPDAFEALTRREREIARYVSGGLTNPEIAGELHLSPRTVEHHVASILRKLELPSRRALVRGLV